MKAAAISATAALQRFGRACQRRTRNGSLANNERDEFSHWMSGTGDPDYEESRDVDIAPRKRRDLVNGSSSRRLTATPILRGHMARDLSHALLS